MIPVGRGEPGLPSGQALGNIGNTLDQSTPGRAQNRCMRDPTHVPHGTRGSVVGQLCVTIGILERAQLGSTIEE
jgi:hypothetical protein